MAVFAMEAERRGSILESISHSNDNITRRAKTSSPWTKFAKTSNPQRENRLRNLSSTITPCTTGTARAFELINRKPGPTMKKASALGFKLIPSFF